ncbi:chaperone NapD [Coralliovum pocilloporae]|uniref:chaperone NapD n=1 Tax=Coralliovum pocilloporae TaxID=3066369 RepID=UPI0033076F4D
MRNATQIETHDQDAWHISSLLVTVKPENVDQVSGQVAALTGAEVARQPVPSKLIVTLEAHSEAEIAEGLNAIQKLDGVVAASLIFHQSDTTNLDEILPDTGPDGHNEEIRS